MTSGRTGPADGTAVPRPTMASVTGGTPAPGQASTYFPSAPVVDMASRVAAAQLAAARVRAAASGSGDSSTKGKVVTPGAPAAAATPTVATATPDSAKPNTRTVVGRDGLPTTINLNPKPGSFKAY